jgi:hypothetical protein
VTTIYEEDSSPIVSPVAETDETHHTFTDPLHGKYVILETHPTVASTPSSQVFPTFNGSISIHPSKGALIVFYPISKLLDNTWDILTSDMYT